MPDYNKTAARVAATLAKFGSPATLERVVRGEYDPNEGAADVDSTQVYNTAAVRGTYTAREIDGTRILSGDVRFYVSPELAVEPQPGDVIGFGGNEYVVITSSPVKPAAVVVLHDVQARNA